MKFAEHAADLKVGDAVIVFDRSKSSAPGNRPLSGHVVRVHKIGATIQFHDQTRRLIRYTITRSERCGSRGPRTRARKLQIGVLDSYEQWELNEPATRDVRYVHEARELRIDVVDKTIDIEAVVAAMRAYVQWLRACPENKKKAGES